jgi:hypothetical protein
MKSSRFRAAVVVLLVALTFTAAAFAGPIRGWERIGQAAVSDRPDHDTIPVTGRQGNFRAIQIKVQGHAVQFREVKIHFANGGTQNVALREIIPAGGESRVIDVEGGDRVIRSIELAYDAQSFRGRRARVVLYGRN